MRTYTIPVTWEMFGELKIKASTLEEAFRIADDINTGLPKESFYVDDSFVIDRVTAEILEEEREERRKLNKI